MSENIPSEGINININNSDQNSSEGGSFLDKIFNLGIKLLVPLILVFALFSVIVFFGVILPLLEGIADVGFPVLDIILPLSAPLTPAIGGLGVLFGWLTGR